ncbi:uncharacterized protein LOC135201309 [Macrobrachium nipponense]|uniref:uncharacterized protein LOC135201309 n=1 Tax=Macrobrachium nipponense TaxID=159736 RepID=UPI0030C8BF98
MAKRPFLNLLLTVAIVGGGLFLGSARAAEAEDADEDDARTGRIFAYYSTTQVTKLTTVTITGLTTCFSTASQAAQGACQGRKKRVMPSAIDADLLNMEVEGLDGSLGEEFEAGDLVKREAQDPSREGKKLTIWSTNYTTITVTSTSIQSLTTVSATALCTYPNQSQTCFGG